MVGELQIGDEGCTAANARRFGKTCTTSQLWVADADGGNARELFPESTDYRSIIDVSPTGDAMVFMAPADIDGQTVSASYLATLGPTGDVIDARVISNDVPDGACEGLCGMDSWHAFSPDGSHLAFVRFVRRDPAPEYGAVIAIMDLATGEVDELESTRASGSEGGTSMPRWSPDGTHFLFTRDKISNAINEFLDTGTFAVDVDGRNLRQLVDAALSARDGAWSPDGSTIAFTSAVGWLGVDQHSGKRENFNEDSDVYTVRADGSDLRRLTNFAPTRVDRGAPVQVGGHVNSWTRDGRIVFTLLKWAGEGNCDESAARAVGHGRRWRERAAARWVEPGSPERGRVRGLPVPAGRRRIGVQGLTGDPRRDVRPLSARRGPPAYRSNSRAMSRSRSRASSSSSRGKVNVAFPDRRFSSSADAPSRASGKVSATSR